MLTFFFGFSCKELWFSEGNGETGKEGGFFVCLFLRGLKSAVNTKGNGRGTDEIDAGEGST